MNKKNLVILAVVLIIGVVGAVIFLRFFDKPAQDVAEVKATVTQDEYSVPRIGGEDGDGEDGAATAQDGDRTQPAVVGGVEHPTVSENVALIEAGAVETTETVQQEEATAGEIVIE